MKPFKNIYVIIGFMLFALFFGAGNLIYPAFLGIYSGSNLTLAILGFCLTGVTLPLLGVVAVAYSGASDVEDFARLFHATMPCYFRLPSICQLDLSLRFQGQVLLHSRLGFNQF